MFIQALKTRQAHRERLSQGNRTRKQQQACEQAETRSKSDALSKRDVSEVENVIKQRAADLPLSPTHTIMMMDAPEGLFDDPT